MFKIKQKIFRFLLSGAFLLMLLITSSGFKNYSDISEYTPDSSKKSIPEIVPTDLPVNEQPDSVRYKKDENGVYQIVPDMPMFPGNLHKYLADAIKYPRFGGNPINGRVICQFIIHEDGSITDVIVLRGVDPILDKEAVRVIEEMPNWEPGRYEGKPVKCKFYLPINFKSY